MDVIDTIKRGDTFERTVNIPSSFADGYFTGWTIASQLRTSSDGLISSLVCTWVDSVTTRDLVVQCLDTTGWKVGKAVYDVQFTRNDGYVVSTSDFLLSIVMDRTHA